MTCNWAKSHKMTDWCTRSAIHSFVFYPNWLENHKNCVFFHFKIVPVQKSLCLYPYPQLHVQSVPQLGPRPPAGSPLLVHPCPKDVACHWGNMGSAALDTSDIGLQWAQAAESKQIFNFFFLISRNNNHTITNKQSKPCSSHSMYICSASYINKCHDPESIVHTGLLFLYPMGQVAQRYAVLYDWTVSQHASEMMYDLSLIPCVIPTACLWEERICNQWAH